jgi:hypothetical protein
MRLDEHFDARDKVEEEGHAGQMDAAPAPARQSVEHSRKDGDGGRRIENRRNSEPEQVHLLFTLLLK